MPEGSKPSDVVYYFGDPTIAMCRKCDEFAIYKDGLICPKCRQREGFTMFTWDSNTPHPEG